MKALQALLVVGARPNFMKIKPVLDALEIRGVDCLLVHTGQHYDAKLSQVFFDELGIRAADEHLNVGSGSHAVQTAAVMVAFEKVVDREQPDMVVVVGDVNSTLACALVGAKAGVHVTHVESGLRSRDWSMPEEINRVATDHISDLLLAPSPDGVANLAAEGITGDRVALVGNVMIDTLLSNVDQARERPILDKLGLERKGFGLVTLHRPANVDDPAELDALIGALGAISTDYPLVFPVHPRTVHQLDGINMPEGIIVTEPFGYLDFVALQDAAALVLTDSGGVQEETTVLGTPCLTLRDNTERPITITEGTNTVVGRDPEAIVAEARVRLENGWPVRRPALWDGMAGERCADAIIESVRARAARRV
ncbi:MAG: UDP-N-acetylglucosamine 2-epimerase (non-hydrolyzing) [Acidimicrobiia bacterium]|nr:UDP-N-acetylglucosamine 2-epimerase (non-hydrolyzing) [Acidimicrobiia bacterium]